MARENTARENTTPQIRQAAILLASVDAETARQLFARMPSMLAKQVRAAMIDLGRVDPKEQKRVLAEFQRSVSAQPVPPKSQVKAGPSTSQSPATSGINSGRSAQPLPAGSLAPQLRTDQTPVAKSPQEQTPLGASYSATENQNTETATWSRLPPRQLAELLQTERPTVIAVVLSQLSTQDACLLLQELPATQRTQALSQLATLQQTDPEILGEMHNHLSQKLAFYRPEPESDGHVGLNCLQAILQVSSEQVRSELVRTLVHEGNTSEPVRQWLASQTPETPSSVASSTPLNRTPLIHTESESSSQLGTHSPQGYDSNQENNADSIDDSDSESPLDGDEEVATIPMTRSHSAPQSIHFDSLAMLSSEDLVTLIDSCEPALVLLAMSGASAEMVRRIKPLFIPKDWRRFESRLRQIGPVQLRDVDRAQQAMADFAIQMMAEGKISLPATFPPASMAA